MMRALLAVFFLTLAASEAAAHTRSQSTSRWSIEGDHVDVQVVAEALDVTRLYALGGGAPLDALFAEEAARAFTLKAGGQACARDSDAAATLAPGGRVVARLSYICPAGALAQGAVEIESRLFFAVAASHLHFVSVRSGEGTTAEAVLTETRPVAHLSTSAEAAAESFGAAVLRFIPIGAEHVWTGLDHVAFILALVLLAGGRLRELFFAATGFTLGHSATLGLAALGVVHPDTITIEALIGFTIAFVALEVGRQGRERILLASAPTAFVLAIAGIAAVFGLMAMSPLVWFGLAAFVFAYPRGFPQSAAWLALIFGLIHGCGFAGALAELELPRARLLESLLGFNLGVEFGQLAVIAGVLALGLLAKRAPPRLTEQTTPIAAAALLALGVYWFIGRLIA